MKINEIKETRVTKLDMMSAEDSELAREYAAVSQINIIDHGTGSSPMIFDVDRNGLKAAMFLSRMRNAGVEFDDQS